MIRGQVRWYTFRSPDKRRPILVLTRTAAISFLTNVTIAPITTNVRNIPTEVYLSPEEDGVLSICAVNLDTIQTVSQSQIGPLVTTLSSHRMEEVDVAIAFALGLDRNL